MLAGWPLLQLSWYSELSFWLVIWLNDWFIGLCYCLDACLIGWLTGLSCWWLVDCLLAWLVDWAVLLFFWLHSWTVLLVSWFNGLSYWLVIWSNDWFTGLCYWSYACLIGWFTGLSYLWLIACLLASLVDWTVLTVSLLD
jgi:hypothetical protein